MNKLEKKTFTTVVGGKELSISIGEMAKQAAGSVFMTYGNTNSLITVAKKELDEQKDFCPLTINYEEKQYSIGEIPGNYLRRESRPTEKATLTARLIDRPLRPLLPEKYNQDVQVVVTVLGYDQDFEPDMLSITGASLSMVLGGVHLSKLVSGLTLGILDGEYIVNPSFAERQKLDFELKVAGTLDALNMIELKADEADEQVVLEALEYAHSEIKKLIEFQQEILDFYEKKILIYTQVPDYNEDEYRNIDKLYAQEIETALRNTTDRSLRGERLRAIKEDIINSLDNLLDDELEDITRKINKIVDDIVHSKFVELIVNDKYRLDGRNVNEIRELNSRIDVLKKTHGSALFTRGETQSLAVCTLGTKRNEQILDGLEDQKQKRFLLHYNFPPYSVGEVGRIGSPGRREIGHGSLAEKAILPVLPTEEEFPYTIRLVSEILESNGSSSQATICASTLALMDSGVPIKKPVAGIAMGLIKTKDDFTILTDIAGLEDHLGDMDFKVAGTRDGITAIQMDIKIDGIDNAIFKQGLAQAKTARLEILDHMEKTIAKPREDVSKNAPKIIKLNIEPKKIKEVIGRGGDTINKIIEKTDVQIDIEDTGEVLIYGKDRDNAMEAKEIIEKIAKVYKKDEIHSAKVKRIEKYGAFVKFDDGMEALLHISDISDKRIEKVEDVLKMDQEVKVKIKEVDEKGRLKVILLNEEKSK